MGKQLNFKRPVGVYIIIPGLYIVVLLSQSDDYNIQEKKTCHLMSTNHKCFCHRIINRGKLPTICISHIYPKPWLHSKIQTWDSARVLVSSVSPILQIQHVELLWRSVMDSVN